MTEITSCGLRAESLPTSHSTFKIVPRACVCLFVCLFFTVCTLSFRIILLNGQKLRPCRTRKISDVQTGGGYLGHGESLLLCCVVPRPLGAPWTWPRQTLDAGGSGSSGWPLPLLSGHSLWVEVGAQAGGGPVVLEKMLAQEQKAQVTVLRLVTTRTLGLHLGLSFLIWEIGRGGGTLWWLTGLCNRKLDLMPVSGYCPLPAFYFQENMGRYFF